MVSVTQVLDAVTEPELLKWLLTTPKAKREQISEEAKTIGKTVEQLVYADIRGTGLLPTAPPTPVPVLNCLQAWQRFKEQYPLFPSQVKGIQGEYSDGTIIGHPDLEVEDARGWGIVDLKCAGAIYPKYFTQTAEYACLKLLKKAHSLPAFVGILRLDKKTGQYDYQELVGWDLIQREIQVFEAYYTIYQHGEAVRERTRLALEQELLNGV